MSGQSLEVKLQSEQVTGIVLAGGASRRMGSNKALLTVDGVRLIERTVRCLEQVCGRVLISANDPNPYQFLGLACVGDLYAGKGPMAGLHAALKASNSTWNVVAACDMPFINEQFIQGMLDMVKMQDRAAEALIPVVQGRMHPLLAVYRRDVVAGLECRLQRGELRMTEWVNKLKAVFVNEEQLEAVTGLDPRMILFNMNDPEDYQAACIRKQQ